MAHVEIYILNYNGSSYLPGCLDSLSMLEVKEHSVTVNVIDNGSDDDSEDLIKRSYPNVNYISLGFNGGFSKGNNLGVLERKKCLKLRNQKADYHVFLNNDTAVTSNWLTSAIESFSRDKTVGIVGSKSLFYDRFIPLRISVPLGFRPCDYSSSDTRELGIFLTRGVQGENIHTNFKRTKAFPLYPEESTGRWLSPQSKLYLAVIDPAKPAHAVFCLENHHPALENSPVEVFFKNAEEPLSKISVRRHVPERIEVHAEPVDYVDLIQNAGSYVRTDWQAGDRGFLELDSSNYNSEEEVDAVCGVSLFIKDELWKKLGGFDDLFFAYYEDTDLSLRARLLGYKCVYSPTSVLRHIHCGSSGEYSEYFVKNVVWSRMIFGSKMMPHGEWTQLLSEYKEKARAEFRLFKQDHLMEHRPYLRAYCRYLKNLPRFWKNRCYSITHRPWRLFQHERN